MKTSADIIIVGAGIVGLSAALASAYGGRSQNLRVTLIDAEAPDDYITPAFDGRASAIAASSYKMFEALRVSAHLDGKAGPINDILISDGAAGGAPSPLSLHFDAREIEPIGEGEASPMGYMIENRHLRSALLAQIKQEPRIQIIAPAKVVDSGVEGAVAFAALDDGTRLTASLLIAADGRASQLRKRAGIEVTGWPYEQMGIVTTVAHELPHNEIAHELFLPSGPFAILPLADDMSVTGFGRHRSNIVWSDSARAAKAAAALPDDIFAGELARRFGDFLGTVKPAAPRWVYPLGLQIAKSYTAPRLVLIGDAAHAIHPIAGQGLNMGLRDVAALADVIESAAASGQDIGADLALSDYASWRRFDNQLLALATDMFTRLFSNDIAPIKHARRLGLGAIDKLPAARKFFMREAAGETGELPSLLR